MKSEVQTINTKTITDTISGSLEVVGAVGVNILSACLLT